MTQDRKQSGSALLATLIVVFVLIAYPLSIGPAYWVCGCLDHPPPARTLFHLAYGPVLWVYEMSEPPVQQAIVDYCTLFP